MTHQRTVELLSPAGDWECARAAIENGANAIYFGLDCGFNARYRAQNFGLDDLPDLMRLLRQRGVRGYATMNTLAFASELPKLVDVIEQLATSGVDAVLVQDFGVARIVREICPEMEIHASTQMSLTSAETIEVARDLGLSRAVVARELSVAEIRKITAATDLPIEVFIHGALCVAYSGQCLTSESLGGRSANRGQCAQACRLPYELIVDGKDRDLGDVRYLLSPQDLAGYAAIPDLVDAGVASLKIEGRLKTPEYVANITGHYRAAIDEAIERGTVTISESDKREMELSFSRGFSPGWIEGNDHKRLVPGLNSAKRGILLGTIIEIQSDRIKLWIDSPVALGDGLAIPAAEGGGAQGGRIYSLEDQVGNTAKRLDGQQIAWIGFGRDEIDWNKVEVDSAVFKNDDPQLNRRLRQSFSGADPVQRQRVDLQVTAQVGQPLQLIGKLQNQITAQVVGDQPLQKAIKHPADSAALQSKLERFGGTPFQMGKLDAKIIDGPMVPVGMLNQLRRDLVDALAEQLENPPTRAVDVQAGRALLAPIESAANESTPSTQPHLVVLCRTLQQLRAVVQTDVAAVYVDFHDIRQYAEAVRVAREAGKPIAIATVRMQKPGEMGLLRAIEKHQPDFILARNLAAIEFFRKRNVATIADFSLNVANHRSAQWVRSIGPMRVTASYDLNREQLMDLVGSVDPQWLEVVIHQHMPMFHMEHCVFCAVISPGTNKTNCGRPCDRHEVDLRDRVGAEHVLQADVACRNTLYNQTPQSGAETVDDLNTAGVGWYRIELLQQNASQSRQTIQLYQQLLRGEKTAQEVWQQLNATNRVGVTRGTLESKRNPLAIL
ncbi:MAG: U32 family peptidase [Pirellulaceae bacterium]|nr:U32 family peptidase [Pirellulaceae bacterium]